MGNLNLKNRSLIRLILAPLVLLGMTLSIGCAEENEVAVTSVEDDIWAKEFAIFEGRGRGDLSNYVNVASEAYLGWPPSLQEPSNRDNLVAMAKESSALEGEVITITKKGFTHQGDTAVAYFLTHRTRLGVGFAEEDERDVDQYFENVHVWTLQDGEWFLVAGMARGVPEGSRR